MAATLPILSLQPGVDRELIDAPKIASDWLSKLEKHIGNSTLQDASTLFLEECWWRDIIALSWDWTSKHGFQAILKYLLSSSASLRELKVVESGGLQPAFVDLGGLQWIQSGFTFGTTNGHGTGLVRLANVGPDDWRAWIVFTQLDHLDGQKEDLRKQKTREYVSSALLGNGNYGHIAPDPKDLQVLIVGAGQQLMSQWNLCLLISCRTSWSCPWSTTQAHGHPSTDYRQVPPSWRRLEEQI